MILLRTTTIVKIMRLVESEGVDLNQSYIIGTSVSGLNLTVMHSDTGRISLYVGAVKAIVWNTIDQFENAMCSNAVLDENLTFAMSVYNDRRY